jgi:hypothetical protein
MKHFFLACAAVLLPALPVSMAVAATDGIYQLSEVSHTWEGTDAISPETSTADYDALLGDDTVLTYTLPASFSGFTFYRQPYTQITVDTNGSIWFSNTTSTYAFSLGITGKGPVISPWNNDLSCYGYGGVFIQHKINPERVVIEWQTETWSDEGGFLPNNFEAVLFPDGTIRFDYQTFSAANAADFGSGISQDDGSHYLSLTSSYGNAQTLGGKSFRFIDVGLLPNYTLSLLFNGTGSGTIISDPAGIACNTNCSASFPEGTTVTLHQTPHYSLFDGWSNGACSGTGDCLLTINANSAVTANFSYDTAHQVKSGDGSYYPSIQAAYNVIADSSVIKLWAVTYTESLTCNRPVTVTLQGGYDSSYTSIVGEPVVSGDLTISDGTVIADGLVIR